MRRTLTLLAFLLLLSCSNHQPTATSGEPVQTIWYDGHVYRLTAGKANQADVTTDFSIEFTYGIRDGNTIIESVIINGIEYRANCSVGEISPTGDVSVGCGPAGEGDFFGGDIPHYADCADGVGIRDIDFTCGGSHDPPPPREEPGPEHIRLKVEGNEEYLRSRFENAIVQEVLGPVPNGEPYTHPPSFDITYNLSDGGDDFFFLDIQHKAEYFINTDGTTDTWGDLYLDDNGTIRPIAGSGGTGFVVVLDDGGTFEGNFYITRVLEPGEYYLRIAPQTEGVTGTYSVWAVGVELEE